MIVFEAIIGILIIFLAVPENQPVIMGVPPPANSHFTHGRRKFLGEQMDEDRAGVPRLVLPEARSSKRKGVSSKSKEPPQKKTSKRKAKGSTSSSDEENFQQENDDRDVDDDMYISDDPIPTKPDVKSSRMDALDIPFFSDSPRTTRSTREKQRLQQLTNHKERKEEKSKEEKSKKASKKGENFIHLPCSRLLNASVDSYLGCIGG
jgi:hypothetical protein